MANLAVSPQVARTLDLEPQVSRQATPQADATLSLAEVTANPQVDAAPLETASLNPTEELSVQPDIIARIGPEGLEQETPLSEASITGDAFRSVGERIEEVAKDIVDGLRIAPTEREELELTLQRVEELGAQNGESLDEPVSQQELVQPFPHLDGVELERANIIRNRALVEGGDEFLSGFVRVQTLQPLAQPPIASQERISVLTASLQQELSQAFSRPTLQAAA